VHTLALTPSLRCTLWVYAASSLDGRVRCSDIIYCVVFCVRLVGVWQCCGQTCCCFCGYCCLFYFYPNRHFFLHTLFLTCEEPDECSVVWKPEIVASHTSKLKKKKKNRKLKNNKMFWSCYIVTSLIYNYHGEHPGSIQNSSSFRSICCTNENSTSRERLFVLLSYSIDSQLHEWQSSIMAGSGWRSSAIAILQIQWLAI